MKRFEWLLLAGMVWLCGCASGPRREMPEGVKGSQARATVLVFVSSECPISNRQTGEMERLFQSQKERGVDWWLVYANPAETEEVIRTHRKEYGLTMPGVRDAKHEWVRFAGARVTPQAVVLDGKKRIVYRGRINDQYLGLGRGRPGATRHDLAEAVEATLAGRAPKARETKAAGCLIQSR